MATREISSLFVFGRALSNRRDDEEDVRGYAIGTLPVIGGNVLGGKS